MEGYLLHAVVALSILQLFNPSTATGLFPPTETNTDYIKTSCKVTMYPRLCYNSLSIYAGKIQTNPKELVHTSLNVTLAFTQATYVTMKRSLKVYSLNHNASAALVDCALAFTQATYVTMKRSLKVYSLNHNASAALVDCAEELGDTVEMLQQSIEELGPVDGASSSRLQLSNIQTWVSAALTNEDTCVDGFANLPWQSGDYCSQARNKSCASDKQCLGTRQRLCLS